MSKLDAIARAIADGASVSTPRAKQPKPRSGRFKLKPTGYEGEWKVLDGSREVARLFYGVRTWWRGVPSGGGGMLTLPDGRKVELPYTYFRDVRRRLDEIMEGLAP
jgi:hypothetical protein